MPVGTRGAVRTLSTADLDDLAPPVVLANTYHLMLRPGVETVVALGGLHRFMDWSGHLLTDSGGYQVFSLAPKVDDDGVTFRSTYDGSSHRLTPERAVELQQAMGADIQMVLDVCPPLPSPPEVLAMAVDRSAAWAARARRCFLADGPEGVTCPPGGGHGHAEARAHGQAQFGIVQGGTDAGLRAESAERTLAIGFDGYAVGGLSVGESRPEMLAALAAAVAELPPDQPRYLMGVGDPAAMVEAVTLGVDLFDCVLPTRLARHGTILTAGGRMNLAQARFAADDRPLDEMCPCSVCARWSRGYLRHLLQVGERSAGRLLTLHNLAWSLRFAAELRAAVVAGRLASLRRRVLSVWG